MYLHFAYENVRYDTWQALGGAEFPPFKKYFPVEDYSEVQYGVDDEGNVIFTEL